MKRFLIVGLLLAAPFSVRAGPASSARAAPLSGAVASFSGVSVAPVVLAETPISPAAGMPDVLASPALAAEPGVPALSPLPALEPAPAIVAEALEIAQALDAPVAQAAAFDGFFDGSRRGGESAAILSNATQAMGARERMIGSARREIYAAYYIFKGEETAGLTKLAMLRAAARRGVKVRLILDGVGSRLERGMLKHLIAEGVEIRYYHPLRLDMAGWLGRRLHEKWLIVDGREMIVGDRNMGDDYFGLSQRQWVSREVLVQGAAAGQAQAHAEGLWNSAHLKPPLLLNYVSAGSAARASRRLDAISKLTAGALELVPLPTQTHSAPARFSHDGLNKKRRGPSSRNDLIGLIRRAQRTLLIENAYVVLPRRIEWEIKEAIARGVKVTVITNSKKTTDNFLSAWIYGLKLRSLAALGVELWEFGGPGTLHAKNVVVDDIVSYVGSHNLNQRSYWWDMESGVIFEDPGPAKELTDILLADRARSTLVAAEGRLLKPQLRSLWEKIKEAFVSLVLTPFDHQL